MGFTARWFVTFTLTCQDYNVLQVILLAEVELPQKGHPPLWALALQDSSYIKSATLCVRVNCNRSQQDLALTWGIITDFIPNQFLSTWRMIWKMVPPYSRQFLGFFFIILSSCMSKKTDTLFVFVTKTMTDGCVPYAHTFPYASTIKTSSMFQWQHYWPHLTRKKNSAFLDSRLMFIVLVLKKKKNQYFNL